MSNIEDAITMNIATRRLEMRFVDSESAIISGTPLSILLLLRRKAMALVEGGRDWFVLNLESFLQSMSPQVMREEWQDHENGLANFLFNGLLETNAFVGVPKILRKYGCDFNIANQKGETPLFSMAKFSPGMMEEMLACGANIGIRDKYGRTCVDEAMSFSSTRLKVAHIATDYGWKWTITNLVDASWGSNTAMDRDIVDFILHCGVSPNQEAGKDGFPLHAAVLSGNWQAVEALLLAGAKMDYRCQSGDDVDTAILLSEEPNECRAKLAAINEQCQRKLAIVSSMNALEHPVITAILEPSL